MSDVVIKVENLTKQYRLGVINHGTLAKDLQAWWAKKRGKDDPNSLITTHDSRIALPSTHASRLTTHDLSALNEKIYALKDISFSVKSGEVLGIIGANGAGKSTLLKILSRVTSPTSGCVKIKGRIGSLLEVGTGFHPELTGRENIYLNGAILGMKKWEIDKKLDEIIDFSGVEKFIDTPVKRYSSGMYVRLAFAVAAHLDPEILVVDEVLAVGDAEFQKKCLGKMGDISKKEGRTVLFVSHNMAAVRQLCDRGILLEGGEVLYEDKTEKLVDYYEASVFERTENKWSTTLRPSGMGQDVFIKRAESFNENNEKASTFFFGEKIGLAIEIESPFQSFKDLSIGVRFETAGDVYIASCLSQDSNSLFSVEPEGASKIKVSFEKFYLTPGTYFLTFSIRKGKMLYDQVVKALRFTVLDFSKDKVLVHNKAWGFLKINSFWSKDVE